jgi:hypothetical protein
MDESQAYTDSQDSPRPGLEGSHPNVILFRDSQVGILKILEIGTLATLEAHNFL